MSTTFEYPDWSRKIVLIAEDYDDNYAVLSALLKKTAVQLLRAHDGKEAIRMVAEQPDIDVILMDISMPYLNGIEALRYIKQQFPDKIVIAQTAHGLTLRITEEKFDDFLLKPLNRKYLINILSKYLS